MDLSLAVAQEPILHVCFIAIGHCGNGGLSRSAKRHGEFLRNSVFRRRTDLAGEKSNHPSSETRVQATTPRLVANHGISPRLEARQPPSREGAEYLRDFLPSLASAFPQAPSKDDGHVPAPNLQDFRPPNERASVRGIHSEDSKDSRHPRLILSYLITGSPGEP